VNAHRVNIFAYIKGDTVYTESYFPDGRNVDGGRIEVYDSLGNKLLEGKTNKNGQFNFKPPKRDDLRVVLIASMGHKASYTILKDELSNKITQRVSMPEELSNIDLGKIKRIIDSSLDERLEPIIKELKRQKEVSFTEIIGGAGYIFGIFGIILYFVSRKKRR
jgi:nickel transport protein